MPLPSDFQPLDHPLVTGVRIGGPPDDLASIVTRLVVLRSTPIPDAALHGLPSMEAGLWFCHDSDGESHPGTLHLAAPPLVRQRLPLGDHRRSLGVIIHVESFPLLFGRPAQLGYGMHPAGAVLGADALRLETALQNAPDDDQRIHLLVEEIRRRLASVTDAQRVGMRQVRRLAELVHAHPPDGRPLQVSDLADHLDLSERQVLRLFRVHFGLTPKQYLSRLRFARCIAALAHDDLPLARLAITLGCSDQAHLSREVRRFARMSIRDMKATPGIGALLPLFMVMSEGNRDTAL